MYIIDAGVVEFDDFLKIVLEHRSTENAPNEILAAFQHYDTQRLGYIDSKQLRYILTNTGEKLTDRDGK
jgi:Ca2+-binding EF-hand superfamily protein